MTVPHFEGIVCWQCETVLDTHAYRGIGHVYSRTPGESGEQHAWECPTCGAFSFQTLTPAGFDAHQGDRLSQFVLSMLRNAVGKRRGAE